MPRGSAPVSPTSARLRQRPPVGQAFAGLLAIGQAVHVRRSADQAIGDAVAVLVEHDAGVEIAVAVRVRAGPDEHLHARPLAVGRRAEVRVVGAGAVLCLGAHGVVADAAAPVVVDLEVAAGFVEAVLVLHVVDEVVQVEEIGHRRRTIGARRLRQVQREVEGERRRRRSDWNWRPANCWRPRPYRPGRCCPGS